MKKNCEYPGCPNVAWSGGDKYCYGHEQKVAAEERRAAAEAEKTPKQVGRPRTNIGTCSLPGCQEPAVVKGMCQRHYQSVRRQFG